MEHVKPLVQVRNHGSGAFSATVDSGLYAATGLTATEAVSRVCQSLGLSKDQVEVKFIPTPPMLETPPYSY